MSETLRNVPVQARSTSRLNTLRQATLTALEAHGRDHLSTATIAEISGCSIGTVYRYYKDAAAALDDVWPERDTILDDVAEILARPLPMVTASREKDRERLMLEARTRMALAGPMMPEERDRLRLRLSPEVSAED